MLKLLNGILYDTSKAVKVLDAIGKTGKRTLLKFKKRTVFFIRQEDPPTI